MAIAAVNAVIAYMMFVTELNWLLTLNPLPGVPRRSIDLGAHPKRRDQDENGAENAELGESVGTVLEDLGHRFRRLLRSARNGKTQRAKLHATPCQPRNRRN